MTKRRYWKVVAIGQSTIASYSRPLPGGGNLIFTKKHRDPAVVDTFIVEQNAIARSCSSAEEYESTYNTYLTLMS